MVKGAKMLLLNFTETQKAKMQEISFINNCQEVKLLQEQNVRYRAKVQAIDKIIDNLYSQRRVLTDNITRNVESITALEGYECVLSSTRSEKSKESLYSEVELPIGSYENEQTSYMDEVNSSEETIKVYEKPKKIKVKHTIHGPRRTKRRYTKCNICQKEMLKSSIRKHQSQYCKAIIN
jgi:hypothetical protein